MADEVLLNKQQNYFFYPTKSALVIIIPSIFSLIIGLFLIPTHFEALTKFLMSFSSIESIDWEQLLKAAPIPLFLGFVLLARHNSLKVSNEGIRVKYFLFLWKTINWSDVISVSYSPFNKNSGIDHGFYIKVKRLSIFHRFLGGYIFSFQPVIEVRSNIQDYDLLINLLQERIVF